MADSDFLVAGLGNPGLKYEHTRHNVGFMALDHFASSVKCQPTGVKCKGCYCRQLLFDKPVILVRPETFMNHSGQCISCFVRFFKVPLSNILVLHDDLDLPAGKVKVVARGGGGGHNGIRSIIQHLGSNEFARIKIGIGRPPSEGNGAGIPVERYVLARFSAEEEKGLDPVLKKTTRAIELFLTQSVDSCMNQINGK